MKYLNLFFILYNFLVICWIKPEGVQGIVGGSDAFPGQFKYIVAIQADYVYACTGSIIGEKHVITAANCVIDENGAFKPNKFTVVAGATNLHSTSRTAIQIDVETIYVHKDYKRQMPDPNNVYFDEVGDIAVLRMKQGFLLNFNDALTSLKLPERKQNNYRMYPMAKATVAGFGSDSPALLPKRDCENAGSRMYAAKLAFLPLVVSHKNACKHMYPFPITEKHICASVEQPVSSTDIKGTCHGDNGSPLVLGDDILIGVLSQSRHDCNEKHSASLYTRVTTYAAFIKKAMADTIRSSARLMARIAVYTVVQPNEPNSLPIERLVEVTS